MNQLELLVYGMWIGGIIFFSIIWVLWKIYKTEKEVEEK